MILNEYIYAHPKLVESYFSNKRYKVWYGGRGGMKTETAARLALETVRSEHNIKFLCTRNYQNKIRNSVYSVLIKIIKTYNSFAHDYVVLKDRIYCPSTNSEFVFLGLQNIGDIKGLDNVKYIWLEEAETVNEEQFTTLDPTFRLPGVSLMIVFNPRYEHDYIYQRFIINNDPMASVVKIGWRDNPFFTRKFVGSLVDLKENDEKEKPMLYKHIWEGECITKVEGALFKSDWFKIGRADNYDTVYVSIDPSGTSKDTSDACGLVVVAKKGNYYYVLDDTTKIASPLEWANQAIILYNKYEADSIVCETNYGGDMVKTIIKQIDSTIPIKEIRASRGKMLRAEPIASLYEQGLVMHVRQFSELEYECVTYTGDPKQKSPNRLDALVHGITSLLVKKTSDNRLVGTRF